jgi:hypothetical protein
MWPRRRFSSYHCSCCWVSIFSFVDSIIFIVYPWCDLSIKIIGCVKQLIFRANFELRKESIDCRSSFSVKYLIVKIKVTIHFLYSCISANKLFHSKLNENVVKCIFAFTHLTVVFSIIWFFIGHIWIFQPKNVCKTNASKFSVVILIFEYIIGIWYLCSRIWNSPSVLQWLQKTIQHRLGKFSDDSKSFHTCEARECSEPFTHT